ncbi:MAG TPA: LptA/OstA family protein [Longimicrobiales bacterium]|nr:LptA/OstA family protein [Longimicrobiales bacterium]
MGRLALTVSILLLLSVSQAQAQQSCTVLSSGTTNFVNQGTPEELVYVTVPVLSCPGGRRISANNAYISQASGRVQLMGNVQFQDSARTLNSTNAEYFSRNQRMVATGNVVLVHRTTNSTIRSQQLEYTEATAVRESHVQAIGGNPRAVFRQASQPDSTVLWAQQIDIFGEDRLRGTGDARLQRDSLTATGYIIEYDQAVRQLELSGSRARVELPSYRLTGDSITAVLTEGEDVEEVLSRHGAHLDSDDMEVTAAAIRLFFEDGGVTRLVAMQWDAAPGAALAVDQARVVSDQFNMTADSVDVLAPGQQLQEAVAIGGAWVERISPDSLRPYLPEASDEIMDVIANDWMRGDTVRAFFTEGPVAVAVADTAADPLIEVVAEPADAGERVLERLLAIGAPAQAMHRVRPENAAADTRLSIAYLVGAHVEVAFVDGLVTVVSASDDVRGVYLQPSDAARRAAPGGESVTGSDGGRE